MRIVNLQLCLSASCLISVYESDLSPPRLPRTTPTPRYINLGRCSAIDDPHKVVKVVASDGKSGDQRDVSYTNCKVIGNGSFGVVFQAKLVNAPKDQEDIAIKKVLQDKRFKVSDRRRMKFCRMGMMRRSSVPKQEGAECGTWIASF